MTLRKVATVPFMAVALFLAGCGADCAGNCEDAKDCDGVTDEEKDLDCDKFCESFEKLAEDADCEDEWDDLMSCVSDDVCADDACTSENEKYGECIGKYCTDHAEECASAIGG